MDTASDGGGLVWPEIAVTADVIALRRRKDALPGHLDEGGTAGGLTGGERGSRAALSAFFEVLLVKRKYPPYEGSWALPGGGVEISEDLEDAARRELMEETGINPAIIRQFRTYGMPGRDPRCRVVSVVYWTILDEAESESGAAGSDAAETAWMALSELPALAFDHAEILKDAVASLFGDEPHKV